MDTQLAAKHSGIGIASFVVSIIALIVLLIAFLTIGIAAASGVPRKNIEAGAGLGLVFAWLLTLIGLGLGIAGAMIKNSKKTFSIIGIVFSASTIVISLAVIALGIAVKH